MEAAALLLLLCVAEHVLVGLVIVLLELVRLSVLLLVQSGGRLLRGRHKGSSLQIHTLEELLTEVGLLVAILLVVLDLVVVLVPLLVCFLGSRVHGVAFVVGELLRLVRLVKQFLLLVWLFTEVLLLVLLLEVHLLLHLLVEHLLLVLQVKLVLLLLLQH